LLLFFKKEVLPLTFSSLDRGDGVRLAYVHTPGQGPTIVFLPGFMSDMTGDKAVELERWAAAPFCASIIPAMAPAAARSPTVQSADGPTMRWC
jgi:pimeloyl-ACP methyl ester carboxylesterase